jgi:hypothetical protein
LRKMHATYVKNNEDIKLSEKNRKIITSYMAAFISTIVFVWVLIMFYFIEPSDRDFFSLNVTSPISTNDNYVISPWLVLSTLFLKIVLSISGLALSGYMVFLSTIFTHFRPLHV